MPFQPPPLLGSLTIQSPSQTPKVVYVSPSTCHDIGLFKGALRLFICFAYCRSLSEDLLREYRRIDDTITMRLNRSNAQFRDMDRSGIIPVGNTQNSACEYVWKELLGAIFID